MVNKVLPAQNELSVTVNTVTVLNLYGCVLQFYIHNYEYIIYGYINACAINIFGGMILCVILQVQYAGVNSGNTFH